MLGRVMLVGVLFLSGLVILYGFIIGQQTREMPGSNDTITVATTIFPLADIAREVGGSRVRVVQLLPAGASPHSYTLTPQQLADIQDARALFVIGHGLDDWAAQGVARIIDMPVVAVDANIELREFGEGYGEDHEEEEYYEYDGHGHKVGSIDPHYWLTVPHGQEIARTIAATLQNIDPEHEADYGENLRRYVAELESLEQELMALAGQAKQREFVAIHDGWSYLAAHYGLELVATYEPVEGREPSINDMRVLQEILEEHGIATFFTEPQKQSTASIRFLRDDFGLTIEVLDYIGGGEGGDSYAEMMRQNVRAITQ